MSNWFHLQVNTAPTAASTVALTDAFMAMDAALSRVQTAVDNYRAVTRDSFLDNPWDVARTQCDEAIATYLALTAPNVPYLNSNAVDRAGQLVDLATQGVETFEAQYGKQLNDAANTMLRLAAEARQAQEEAARRAQLAQQEAARRAAELPGEVQRALSSVSTRLQAARTRLDGVPAVLSAMFREFPAGSSADLVNNEDAARWRIDVAADCLARARTAQHADALEEALALAKECRGALNGADQVINAVSERLRVLRELRLRPERRSEQVRFVLRDAQMFAVAHGLTKQWASVLDAQLHRIETLEAPLGNSHPDYWAYATGLDKVADFIQSVVAKMRESLRR